MLTLTACPIQALDEKISRAPSKNPFVCNNVLKMRIVPLLAHSLMRLWTSGWRDESFLP